MGEHLSDAQRPVYSVLAGRAAQARASLVLRADPHLESAALAARATLGDRTAIAEITYRPARRKTKDLPGARTVYRCSCRAIITGPEARCRKCGSRNTVNAAGRGSTIR